MAELRPDSRPGLALPGMHGMCAGSSDDHRDRLPHADQAGSDPRGGCHGSYLPGIHRRIVTQLVTPPCKGPPAKDHKWPLTWSGWPDLNRRPLRPEATSEADCQCGGMPDLRSIVRRRPLVSTAGDRDSYSLGYSPVSLPPPLDANYWRAGRSWSPPQVWRLPRLAEVI